MVARLNPCNPDRLRLLAEDRLPPAEMIGLEEHLQHCAGCRKTLDGLVGGEPWLEAVRRYLGADPTESYEAGPPAEVEVEVDKSLGFLAPSDWPDSLGRLGTYEVKGVVGRGGMGVVLKAFDPALSRNVAIKVLSASLATCGAARRRFLREAKAAAAVAHEHVVSVFAVVETAGLPFLVMEYVPGRSLQDRLDQQGPLGLPEILRIGMQTAAGLAAAHAQGLVHRDVKPANILLENGIERVKLTDFGLARAAADAGVTQSGLVAGTPHYMAPEQARGEATDHRADLFSLGSTLYAICTGHPPFRAESPLAVLRRVSDDEPRPVRQINPEIPEWLEAIIARLHSKDPVGRFPSAAELAELLSRCLAHVQEPLAVPLPPELVPSAARRDPRRQHRLRWAGVGLLGVTAILGAAIPFWPARLPGPRAPERTAGVRPGRDGLESVLVVRPARSEADENEVPFREAWDQAGALEADIHRRSDPRAHDPVSALARSLADRAGSLEREIVSGRDAAPAVPTFSPSQP
jgi:serine/threonine-protein kinase